MFKLLDKIELRFLIMGSMMLGLAPFVPEPHLFEKIRMLMDGSLSRPLDIFDLMMHAALPALLLVKLIRLTFLSLK